MCTRSTTPAGRSMVICSIAVSGNIRGIETAHNHKRRHLALLYKTIEEFELLFNFEPMATYLKLLSTFLWHLQYRWPVVTGSLFSNN